MKRRKFIQHTAHSLAVPGFLGSLGLEAKGRTHVQSLMRQMTESDRVLVLIFLDGGNDGLNTVIPYAELSAMHEVRPHVVLPENKLERLWQSDLGLHPSLSGFRSLYGEGRLAIIQSVGYPEPNFSHFRSTDIWMSGSGANEYVNSGWTGRVLERDHPEYPAAYPNPENPDPLAIEIGYGASLLFQGQGASMGMVLSGPESFYELVDNVEAEAPDTPAGAKLDYIRLIARQSQQYGEVVKKAAERIVYQEEFPETELGLQLKIVSRLIAGGLKTPLYMVRIGGFDTHDTQVVPGDTERGFHADLLKDLNDSVLAFLKDLELHQEADRVVGMTFSEFGRTIISNASNGTDHGTAGPLFVFGNAVKGGIIGENPVVPRNATWEDDLPMQYDFRQVYASLMEQWLGVESESDREGVLFDDFATIPIIGESEIVTGFEFDSPGLTVYPNPLEDLASIQFPSSGQYVQVDLFDLNGRRIEKIFRGNSREGLSRILWNTASLSEGHYVVYLQGLGHAPLKFRVIK